MKNKKRMDERNEKKKRLMRRKEVKKRRQRDEREKKKVRECFVERKMKTTRGKKK